MPFQLRRRPGQRVVIRDRSGRILVEVGVRAVARGQAILSIDARSDLEIDRCDGQPPPAAHAAA